VDNCYIYGGSEVNGPIVLSYAYVIEDCDAVTFRSEGGGVLENILLIKANAGGHGPSNHRFGSKSVFDTTTTGASVRITGGGSVQRCKFNGVWIAGSGNGGAGNPAANGFLIDCGEFSEFEITGSTIYLTQATGLYLNPASCGPGAITGNTVLSCGAGGQALNSDGMYINVPLNFVGPTITGNGISGAGTALRTSATSNRIVVVGNQLIGGAVYGIACTEGLNGV